MNKIIDKLKNMTKREKFNLMFLIITPLCYIAILFFGYLYMDNIKNSLTEKVETLGILSKKEINIVSQTEEDKNILSEDSELNQKDEIEKEINEDIVDETIQISALSIRAGVKNDPNIRDAEIYLPDGEKIEVPKDYSVVSTKNLEKDAEKDIQKENNTQENNTEENKELKEVEEIEEENNKFNDGDFIEYTVRSKDTLFNIGKRFLKNGKGYVEIQKVNNLGDSTTISIGQKLKIPYKKIDNKENAIVYDGDYSKLIKKYGNDILTVNRLNKDTLVENMLLATP